MADIKWTKHTALALQACRTNNDSFTCGVLWALGYPDLGAALVARRGWLEVADRDLRQALEATGWGPETFDDLMEYPDTPEVNAATAKATEAAADLDGVWDQIELLRIDAQRWLEVHCNYDEVAS